MTTQDADGPELAQALDSLTDALSRAVRHAQQEESAFQMAPVELILQVTVSWAEPEGGGAGFAGEFRPHLWVCSGPT